MKTGIIKLKTGYQKRSTKQNLTKHVVILETKKENIQIAKTHRHSRKWRHTIKTPCLPTWRAPAFWKAQFLLGWFVGQLTGGPVFIPNAWTSFLESIPYEEIPCSAQIQQGEHWSCCKCCDRFSWFPMGGLTFSEECTVGGARRRWGGDGRTGIQRTGIVM